MSPSAPRVAPPARLAAVVPRWTVVLAALSSGTGLAIPSGASAQEGCVLGDRGRNDVVIETIPGVGRVSYIGGPHFVCDRGIQIFADSAVAYGERGMSHLMGRVRYVEAERELRAQEARYFSNEGRLQAQGDVRVDDEAQGSSIENGDLVYLLVTEFRDQAEMTVTTGADGRRPQALLTPPPDTATTRSPTDTAPPPDTLPPEPYTVVGDRIFLRGSGYFTASGDVQIVRDSLFAYSDSAEYDQGGVGLALVGSARVDGASYDLTGQTITMTNPGGELSEIHAEREAELVGEDLLLTAARIVVMLADGALERLVATPLATGAEVAVADSVDAELPEALVEDFVLTADSLDVMAPGERLQRVFAAGDARSVSTARDSLNTEVLPAIARNDWLEGDTVIIRFTGSDPVPPMTDVPDADTLVAVEALAAVDTALAAEDTALAAEDTALAGVDTALAGVDTALAIVDTALAIVDTASAAATSPGLDPPPEEPVVEEIIARIDARSLYRLTPNDTTFRAGTDAPAVHYVVGREIRIRLEDGEVLEMRVAGQTQGVHLEPLQRPPGDSAAVSDTLPVPTDTAAVVDTTLVPDTTALRRDSAAADTTLPPGVTWNSDGSSALGRAAPWRPPDPGGPIRTILRKPEPGRTGPGTRKAVAPPLPTPANDEPERDDDPKPQDGPLRPPEDHPWIRR